MLTGQAPDDPLRQRPIRSAANLRDPVILILEMKVTAHETHVFPEASNVVSITDRNCFKVRDAMDFRSSRSNKIKVVGDRLSDDPLLAVEVSIKCAVRDVRRSEEHT